MKNKHKNNDLWMSRKYMMNVGDRIVVISNTSLTFVKCSFQRSSTFRHIDTCVHLDNMTVTYNSTT